MNVPSLVIAVPDSVLPVSSRPEKLSVPATGAVVSIDTPPQVVLGPIEFVTAVDEEKVFEFAVKFAVVDVPLPVNAPDPYLPCNTTRVNPPEEKLGLNCAKSSE